MAATSISTVHSFFIFYLKNITVTVEHAKLGKPGRGLGDPWWKGIKTRGWTRQIEKKKKETECKVNVQSDLYTDGDHNLKIKRIS